MRGDNKIPRLSVFRSDKYIYAQLIDDITATTLAAVSDVKNHEKITKTESSKKVGRLIAEKAKELKISKVKFDRGGFKYHGRIKMLADSARENGLEF